MVSAGKKNFEGEIEVVNLRPKTPAPMTRIEDIGAGLLFVEGGGAAAMLWIREMMGTGR